MMDDDTANMRLVSHDLTGGNRAPNIIGMNISLEVG